MEQRRAWRKVINLKNEKGQNHSHHHSHSLGEKADRTKKTRILRRSRIDSLQSFQANTALVKVTPTASVYTEDHLRSPSSAGQDNCFWRHPNCYLLLTMETQQDVCLGKTACCQRTESLLLRILILRSKHTTIENYSKPSFTKLGIHSITKNEQILKNSGPDSHSNAVKQGPNETTNSCDADF